MGNLGAAYFFLIAKSLLLAPGYPVLRRSFCGFPFRNAPALPESADTLLSSWAPPTHGAGGCATVLPAFLLRLWKMTRRPKTRTFALVWHGKQRCLVTVRSYGEKEFCQGKLRICPPAGLGLLAHRRALSGMGSTSQKQSPEMEWAVAGVGGAGRGNTSFSVLCFCVVPGNLGSCGCSYVPVSGAGCGCRCMAKPELSCAVNLPQPCIIQIQLHMVA